MDQETKNQLERHGLLQTYLRENKARWEGIPALRKRVDAYFARQGALPQSAPDADRDNTATTGAQRGATLDKAAARQRLAELLPPMAASAHLWLMDPLHLPTDELAAARQRALAAQLDIRRPSALLRMSASALIGLAQVTADALGLVPPADLADYDLSAADTQEFETTAASFGVRRGQPKARQIAASIRAEQLAEDLDALNDYVLGELLKAVDTRRAKDPEFVSGFKKAYRVTDRRATRTSKSQPPTSPASGE